MQGATYTDAKVDPTLGPILAWGSPDDAVAWLRKNILVGETFQLAQMERANRWAKSVCQAPEWGLTEFDAQIIVEYASLGRTESAREKLKAHVVRLTKTLERPMVSTEALKDVVDRANKSVTRMQRLSPSMMQAANRFVHLGRRWPR